MTKEEKKTKKKQVVENIVLGRERTIEWALGIRKGVYFNTNWFCHQPNFRTRFS